MGACRSSLGQSVVGPRCLPYQTDATPSRQNPSCRSADYQTAPTKTVTSQVLPDGSIKVTTKTETRNSDGSISVTVVESVKPAGTDDTSASSFASEAKKCVRAQPVPGSVRPPPASPACVSALAEKSRGSLYQPGAVRSNQSAPYQSKSYQTAPTKTVTSQVLPDGSIKVTTKTETRNSDGSISVTVVESVKPAGTDGTSASSFASGAEKCVRAQPVPGSVRPPPVSPACVSVLGQTAEKSRGSLHQPGAVRSNQSAPYQSDYYRNTPTKHVTSEVPPDGSTTVTTKTETRNSDGSISLFPQAQAPYLQNPRGPAQAGSGVFAIVVNGVPITGASKVALITSGIMPGRYWRDFMAGFYGREGGPTLGVSQVPIPGAGTLQPDASCRPAGQTNIFINGREVHPAEVANLLPIMMQPGGRWRMDSEMNVYQETDGMFIGSLRAILARFHQGGGGSGGRALGGTLVKGALRALSGDGEEVRSEDSGSGVDLSGVDWSGVDWSGAYSPDGTSWAFDGDAGFSWYDAGSFFMDS